MGVALKIFPGPSPPDPRISVAASPQFSPVTKYPGSAPSPNDNKPVEYRPEGKVEGQLTELLLDTGCSKTMIDGNLVPPQKINEGKMISMQCPHGDMKQYPTAVVEIEINDMKYKVEAAVVDGLPRPILLGRDVEDLVAMIINQKRKKYTFAVLTRKQRFEKEKEEAINLVKEMVSEGKPKLLEGIFSPEKDAFVGEGKHRKWRRQKKVLEKQLKEKAPFKSVADGRIDSPNVEGSAKTKLYDT